MDSQSIISTGEYGTIEIHLAELIEQKGISKTRLAKLANTNYKNIKRLCDKEVQKVDLDIIARICFVLKCSLSDVMVYNYSENGAAS